MDEGNEGKEGGGRKKSPNTKYQKNKQKIHACSGWTNGVTGWIWDYLFIYLFFSLFFWSIVVSFGFYGWDRVG